jgi:HSP20 family molecular chaperone IbpA
MSDGVSNGVSNGLSLRATTVAHKKRVAAQVEKNNIELEKIKLAHEKRVNDLRNQNALRLNDIKYQEEHKILDQVNRNEKIFNKMRENLAKTKEVTNEEIKNLQKFLIGRKQTLRDEFEKDYQRTTQNNELRLEDANHIANQEIKRLKYKMDLEKQLIDRTGRTETKMAEQSHKNTQAMQKDKFFIERHNAENKYYKQLKNQKENHTKQIAKTERTHQRNLEKRKSIYDQQMQRLQKDAINKKQIKQANFEKDYKQLKEKQERLLQNILGRKEKLIQNLKKDLWREYQIGVKKSEDPFYDFGKLNISVEDIPNGYRVAIPMASHEASHVDMKAEERTLTLSMERKHEFKDDDTDGSMNSMNKYESYVSKVPVEDIINPKTIQKGYQDGKVIFTIAKK